MKKFIQILLCFSLILLSAASYASPPGSKEQLNYPDPGSYIAQENPVQVATYEFIHIDYVMQNVADAEHKIYKENTTIAANTGAITYLQLKPDRLCRPGSNLYTTNNYAVLQPGFMESADRCLYLKTYRPNTNSINYNYIGNSNGLMNSARIHTVSSNLRC